MAPHNWMNIYHYPLRFVGSKLLTGGDVIQMWQCPDDPSKDSEGDEVLSLSSI